MVANSPAEEAEIREDDVVDSIDGWSVGADINQANQRLRLAQRVTLQLRRDEGVRTVELERRPLLRPLKWPE